MSSDSSDQLDSVSAGQPQPGLVDESDVRAIARLLGRIAVVDGDHAVKKRALMDGLVELVEADCWMWNIVQFAPDFKDLTAISVMHGGFSDKEINSIYASAYDRDNPPPYDAPLSEIAKLGKHRTRTRHQLVPDNVYYGSGFAKNHDIATDIDHMIFTLYPVKENRLQSAVGIHRRSGSKPFTDREVRLVHIVTSEIDWLHQSGIPGHDAQENAPKLTPRLRGVLGLLLEGQSRSEIAFALELSEHTINDYVKAIYKQFKVSSRSQLFSRFMSGDGGDVA